MNGEHLLLLLARHGSSVGNQKHVFRSRLDFPLDPKGEQEAQQLGVHVARNFRPSLIVTSPMQRATATAQIAGKHLNVPVEQDNRLLPWHAGQLMGLKRDARTEKMRDYFIQHADIPVPGGESIQDSEKRIHGFLTSALHYARKGGLLLAVTHGSGIKAAHTLVTGHREPTGDAALVEPGGLAGLFLTPSGLEMRALYKGAPQEAKAS